MQKTLPPNAHVMGTFPGVLVSDLMSSSFPRWLVPVLKLLQTPLADSDEECGMNHAIILASTNVTRKRVSYWAAPRLEAYAPHPLVLDVKLGAWLFDNLETLRNT